MTNREIDCLVAEKVFGWTLVGPHPIHKCPVFATGKNHTFAPRFSTDIEAAWPIITRMWDLGWDGGIEWYKGGDGSRMYRATFRRIDKQEECAMGWAGTAPLAIALAALTAVGVEVSA